MKKSKKDLVIDDSALVRQTLTDIINSDSQLEVVGTAADPYFAAQKIKTFIPDVITLVGAAHDAYLLRNTMHHIPFRLLSFPLLKRNNLALRAQSLSVEIVRSLNPKYKELLKIPY